MEYASSETPAELEGTTRRYIAEYGSLEENISHTDVVVA
jgi:hypothetical protein